MQHDLEVRKSPINFIVHCRCGFSRTITRRQNALARARKVKSAIREHDKQVEENQTNASTHPRSWYCEPCAVEVYERRCPHCGKLEKDKS